MRLSIDDVFCISSQDRVSGVQLQPNYGIGSVPSQFRVLGGTSCVGQMTSLTYYFLCTNVAIGSLTYESFSEKSCRLSSQVAEMCLWR